jgi:hypothetical protein
MARLIQFFKTTVVGINMLQSNMACVILATIGCLNLGSGSFSNISTVILVIDAYIGLTLFSHEHN